MALVRRSAGALLLSLAVGGGVISSAQPAVADLDVGRALPLLARLAARHLPGEAAERVPVLVPLGPGQHAAALGLLAVAPGLGAVRLRPAELAAFMASHPELGPRWAPPRHTLLNVSGTWTRAPQYRNTTGLDGSGVVVGIVDTGLDVAHPDFRDANGGTRVRWLIQSGTPRGVHAALESAYGCDDPNQLPCAIYDATDIDALLASGPDAAPRDRDGHGSHVASIAAGNGGVSVNDQPSYVGVAPAAELIVASPVSGGGFSDPDIINAARFIFDRAADLGMPAVVNVSLGSDFGPHDGTGLLEQGLASLVGDGQPGRVLVVAAGNSGALYTMEDQGPFGSHTEAHVSDSAVTRVPIMQPGASGEVKGTGFVWVTFQPGDDVSVGLEGDGEEWISLTAPGQEQGYDGDTVVGAVINNLVNGKSSLTADTNGAVVYWDGSWPGDGQQAILLSGRGDAQLWVTGIGGAGPGATLGLMFARAVKMGTVAVPASHPDLIAVGCTLNRTTWSPVGSKVHIRLQSFGNMSPPVNDSACYFSGAGPNALGQMKPDLLAPGAFVAAAMSHDADPRNHAGSIFDPPGCPTASKCYVVDDGHAISSGTSMSAPFVTGAAALLLQADPALTQAAARELLQAGAAKPRGVVPYDYQQGPGELDLLGSLAVYDGSAEDGAAADVASSFYALSAPYVRPDPDWPVQGVVQMRRPDGGVAGSVRADELRLSVRGGIVTKPLAKLRAGTFHFTISAPHGSGGSEIDVDVRYRGASLGARTLQVGVDAWVAGTGVRAVGGCQLGAPGSAARWRWLLAAVAFAAWSRRRRAR